MTTTEVQPDAITQGRGDRKRTRLGLLAQQYFDIERLRVSQQIRQSHLQRDASPFSEDPIFKAVSAHLERAQGDIDKHMRPLVETHPCWTEFSVHVKGVGPHLLALVMGLIRDIEPFTNVSKLWWLCGLGVVDGKAVRPTKGVKLNYDPRLKSVLLGRVGAQLLMNGDPFGRMLYDEYRPKEEAKRMAGAHRRAIRKVVKLWVACLWDVWRRADGLPVTEHYAALHLGHSDTISPEKWVAFNQGHVRNGQDGDPE